MDIRKFVAEHAEEFSAALREWLAAYLRKTGFPAAEVWEELAAVSA
jgi:hypothetical protein